MILAKMPLRSKPTNSSAVGIAFFAIGWLAFGFPFVLAQPPVSIANVDALVAQLTSDDSKTIDEAKSNLEKMGAEVVPVLFEKLLAADWTLRPRLLEVLAANGREFAKKKLLTADGSEKAFAALIYEHSRGGQRGDDDSPEFAAMVEALLKAIKSEDKYLRAAAGLSLVHDDRSTVFFEHFHEIIPSLISSFETDLVLERRVHCGDPSSAVMVGIGLGLQAFVGDRFIDVEKEVYTHPVLAEVKVKPPGGPEASMRMVLSHNRSRIDGMKAEWETWWKKHSHLSALEIGVLMIERSLRELPAARSTSDDWLPERCLEIWSGSYESDWNDWWNKNKATYKGPIPSNKRR